MTMHAPADLQRLALEQALTAARATVASLEAALGEAAIPAIPIEDLVPAKVIAKELRRSAETVRRWARDQGIGVKIGDAWFVSRKRLEDWMKAG